MMQMQRIIDTTSATIGFMAGFTLLETSWNVSAIFTERNNSDDRRMGSIAAVFYKKEVYFVLLFICWGIIMLLCFCMCWMSLVPSILPHSMISASSSSQSSLRTNTTVKMFWRWLQNSGWRVHCMVGCCIWRR